MRERLKMGILGSMKAGFLKALAKAAAIISMTGKQVGVDAHVQPTRTFCIVQGTLLNVMW